MFNALTNNYLLIICLKATEGTNPEKFPACAMGSKPPSLIQIICWALHKQILSFIKILTRRVSKNK